MFHTKSPSTTGILKNRFLIMSVASEAHSKFWNRDSTRVYALQEFICVNRSKKDELLAALVKNIDSAIPKYPQVVHYMLQVLCNI